MDQMVKEGQPLMLEPSSSSPEPPHTCAEQQQQDSNLEKRLIDQDNFGPWLLVERRCPRRRSNQVQEQSKKSSPVGNEARESVSIHRKNGSKHHSIPTGIAPNGSNSGSLNAGQIGTGSSSTITKSHSMRNKVEPKSNSKNQARESREGLQYVSKESLTSLSVRSGSISKRPTQTSSVNKGLSSSLNSPSNESMVMKPTLVLDPSKEPMGIGSGALPPPTTSSTGILVGVPPSSISQSTSTPLLTPSTSLTPVDPTHGISIPSAGPQPRGFLDIQWKFPATGVGVEPDPSITTSAPLQLEQLPNNPSMEKAATSSQGAKPPSGPSVSATATHSNGEEWGPLLRVGSKLQRKRRINRKDNHPYQAPSTNLLNNEETLLLYSTQGTNEASPSPSPPPSISSGVSRNGVQVISDPIPLPGSSDGNFTEGSVAPNSG
ncbi:hypothetical protein SLA2020_200170 [Shorea laevis]